MSDKESITAEGGTQLNAEAVRAIPLLISAADNTVPITVQQRTSAAPGPLAA
jgi:hypothetical protein